MGRTKTAFISGTITDNPLTIGATTINGAALAGLPTIASPDIAVLILDPAGVYGTPEVVWVTAHTAAATSATISRAKEGSTARAHVAGTTFSHAPTIMDLPAAMQEFLQIDSVIPSTFADAIGAANAVYLSPMRPLTADVTLTGILGSIGVQSGNIDVGIYEWDGTTMTRIVSLGSTACPAVSNHAVFNVADVPLYRGTRYFFAWAADNATVTSGRVTVTTPVAPNAYGFTKAASFPLPATLTGLTSGTNSAPFLMGIVSGGAAFT